MHSANLFRKNAPRKGAFPHCGCVVHGPVRVRARMEMLANLNKMAKAKTLRFKYAFGHFFRSHDLLELFDVYKVF